MFQKESGKYKPPIALHLAYSLYNLELYYPKVRESE
jgi:hypothetical protein